MMTDDKLHDKIKQAAHNAETQDFPGMEKVWNRVGEKLDSKVLYKKSKFWKKLAIAASILLVVTLAFLLQPEKNFDETDIKVVSTDTISTEVIRPLIDDNPIVEAELKNPNIREDAGKILEKQIETPAITVAVVVEDDEIEPADNQSSAPVASPAIIQESIIQESMAKASARGKFESRGIRNTDSFEVQEASSQAKKANPLLVVEGEPIPEGRRYDRSLKEALSRSEEGDEEIVILKEPLYIINGAYYSEEDLFGENPTSPYAPLNKQEIESLTILQGEKAISIYGEKGRKGVVLISTKGGKPAAATSR